MTPEERQSVIDDEHLRLLSLFHYVSGGLTLLISLFFGAWFTIMATVFAFIPPVPHATEAPMPHPSGLPGFMVAIFAVFFVLAVAYGVIEIVAARSLARRRRWLFTLLAALPRLLFIPYGLMLSIFTLLVLERPSVKQSFRRSAV
jgi:hypothetical protein